MTNEERAALDASNGDDALLQQADEIEHTRLEMAETIEAIQGQLLPERLADDAKDVAADVTEQAKQAAIEAVDHAVEQLRTTVPEWAELASVAALEAIDHTLSEVQAALPAISSQATSIAEAAVDHAIEEAKAAVRELGTQARLAVRDATIGKVERMAQTTEVSTKHLSARVVTTVKQNPGLATLTGLGLGWLVVTSLRAGTSQPAPSGAGQQIAGQADHLHNTVGRVAEQAQETAGQVAGQLHDVASQAQDVAGTVAGQAHETAATVAGQARETATSVVHQTQDAVGQLKEQAHQLPTRLQLTVMEHPVAVGVIAAAVGGAAALVIPPTQREHQWMGSARDTLVDRAQSGAQDVVQKVQLVADELSETATNEAQAQGLTPDL